MDFFATQCQSGPFTDARFGVCDEQQGRPAYVDLADESKWIATVENKSQTPVTFTAIDKCVMGDSDELGRGRCDGMLTTDRLLYLLELKDKEPPWQKHAIEQLESTIEFLKEHHKEKLGQYRNKKAFACNRKHAHFAVLDAEQKKRFFTMHGFRLDTQATVILMP